jgi:predicted outer membrane repeat protein
VIRRSRHRRKLGMGFQPQRRDQPVTVFTRKCVSSWWFVRSNTGNRQTPKSATGVYMFVQATAMTQILRVVTVGCLTAASVGSVAGSAQASSGSCRATNTTAGQGASHDLQSVIDDAKAGETIAIEGVCVGSFTSNKALTLVGQPTGAVPTPSLEPAEAGDTILTLRGLGTARPRVTVVDLMIQGSSVSGARGVLVRHCRVILGGSTVVSGNAQSGIDVRRGSLLLQDQATVMGNTAHNFGGGIDIRYGAARLTGSSLVTGNTSTRLGGGVFGKTATVNVLDDATISNNSITSTGTRTLRGGGIAVINSSTLALGDTARVMNNSAGLGAGIYAYESPAVLSDQVTVSGNTGGDGGGIFGDYEAPLTLNDDVSVTGNTASSDGGGIYSNSAGATLNDHAAVTGNQASRNAGGIEAWGGALVMNDSSSVDHNSASGHGGGVSSDILGGTITMNDSSTVAVNSSTQDGGGGYIYNATLTMNVSASIQNNITSARGGGLGGYGPVYLNGASAITGNHASLDHGGIYFVGGVDDVLLPASDWTGTVCGNDPDDPTLCV